jgi:hypothetical protein
MSRSARQLIHEDQGGYHIVSRIVGKQFLMGPAEKDHEGDRHFLWLWLVVLCYIV